MPRVRHRLTSTGDMPRVLVLDFDGVACGSLENGVAVREAGFEAWWASWGYREAADRCAIPAPTVEALVQERLPEPVVTS